MVESFSALQGENFSKFQHIARLEVKSFAQLTAVGSNGTIVAAQLPEFFRSDEVCRARDCPA